MSELVTLEPYNETYLRVRCESSVIYEMCEAFTFTVPGAKFTPAYRNRVWDGKIRLLNTATGLIYKGLLYYIQQFCIDRGYEVHTHPSFAGVSFTDDDAVQFLKSIKNLKYVPHDYQMKALMHAIRNDRALLLSPTASGKSYIIYLLIRYYLTYSKDGCEKALIIVPTTSLVHQMNSDFADYGLDSDKFCHKIYTGQEKDAGQPITITTWQSIYKMPKAWFQKYDLVIGDEAHLFKAKSLTSIMTKLDHCKRRFGFTGTLDGTQTNKLVLEGLFGAVKKVITTSELIDQNHVSNFKVKSIVLTYDDELRKLAKGYTYQDEMDFLVRFENRNKFIKNLTLSLQGNTLLLFQYVEKHGKILYNMIESELVGKDRKLFFVYSKVDGEEREEIRRIVAQEKDAIIVASFGTMSTGVNIPNLDNVIFASPSKSKIRNLQSIGRVLRKAEGKECATLYDIADDLSWKGKKNYTLEHFIDRMKIYAEEKFEYKTYTVKI